MRAPNKTPALAQEWAVWSRTTWDLRLEAAFSVRLKSRIVRHNQYLTRFNKIAIQWTPQAQSQMAVDLCSFFAGRCQYVFNVRPVTRGGVRGVRPNPLFSEPPSKNTNPPQTSQLHIWHENRLEHCRICAAANSVQLTRRNQDAASKPVLDYPVDISHDACKHVTRRHEKRCLSLNSWAETRSGQESVQLSFICIPTPTSFEASAQLKSILAKPITFKDCGYWNIPQIWYSPKLDLPCTLFVTDKAPNGSLVNGIFNKLKKLIWHPLWRSHYNGMQLELRCYCG